jgi:hypothetical protein
MVQALSEIENPVIVSTNRDRTFPNTEIWKYVSQMTEVREVLLYSLFQCHLKEEAS